MTAPESRFFTDDLRELVLYADGDGLPPDDFLRLLGPRLAHLKMPLSGDTARQAALCDRALSDPAFLPNLQTLHAPCNILLAFLRGPGKRQALQHLGVPSAAIVNADHELWQAIADSGCDIRTLEGIRTGDGYAVFQTLAKVCPRIEHVELVLHLIESFGFDLVDHEIYRRPAVLNHLRSLSLVTAQAGNIRPINARMRYNLRHGLTLCFPRLELLNGYAVFLPRTFDM